MVRRSSGHVDSSGGTGVGATVHKGAECGCMWGVNRGRAGLSVGVQAPLAEVRLCLAPHDKAPAATEYWLDLRFLKESPQLMLDHAHLTFGPTCSHSTCWIHILQTRLDSL